MRVLLDQSFALTSQDVGWSGVTFDRQSGDVVDDIELVVSASRRQYDAVCFLGDAHLLDAGIGDTAREHGVVVLVTADRDPIRSLQRVRQYAQSLGALAPGLYRLLSDGFHPAG